MKLITYVLTVSTTFPKTHPRAGQPTGFVEQILNGDKIHTIRRNYKLWEKRMQKVLKGEAVLSLRTWEGKPYGKGTKQKEFLMLSADHGAGITPCQMWQDTSTVAISPGPDFFNVPLSEVAQNDGLSLADMESWFFPKHRCALGCGIIHFTPFRYSH